MHPLLNENSPHYENEDGQPDIYYLEKEMTVDEAIGWCKGNILKYKKRLDKKGQKESDLIKIKTYRNYKALLYSFKNASVREMLDIFYPEVKYHLSEKE
jgi:hypothetical protein